MKHSGFREIVAMSWGTAIFEQIHDMPTDYQTQPFSGLIRDGSNTAWVVQAPQENAWAIICRQYAAHIYMDIHRTWRHQKCKASSFFAMAARGLWDNEEADALFQVSVISGLDVDICICMYIYVCIYIYMYTYFTKLEMSAIIFVYIYIYTYVCVLHMLTYLT